MPTPDPNTWPLISKSRISSWRKLRLRKEREKTGLLVLEGLRLVRDAMGCGARIEAVLFSDDPEGRAVFARAATDSQTMKRLSASVYRVGASDFSQLTDTVHTSGIAAVVAWKPTPWHDFESRKTSRILYCDHVSDPGNLGTLIRTAAGLGLDAVMISPESVEVTNPKTVRATAGAIFRIPVLSPVPIPDVGDWARHSRATLYLADADAPPIDANSDRPRRWALIVGGETHGLSEKWGEFGCRRIGVPMASGVESLNAAVAGALLMDRLINQRRG